MKFKDFQAPVLFSSIFKAQNLGEKNSTTFKDAWEPFLLMKASESGRLETSKISSFILY